MVCHWDLFGTFIKGHRDPFVEEGHVIVRNMQRNRFSREDLREDLRLRVSADDLSRVKSARMERNGEVSVVVRGNEDGS